MRHPATHDKIIIKRDTDGHYVYFSVRDDRDNGSHHRLRACNGSVLNLGNGA
jgi:hypothetical protein